MMTNKLKLFIAICCLFSTLWTEVHAMQTISAQEVSPPKKILTNMKDCFAFEQTDNLYHWKLQPNDSPVIDQTPEAYQGSSGYAPVTVYNNWPQLSNTAIFPYLMTPDGSDPHAEFYSFVQQWYQSSCAIIYRSSDIDSKVIGTGTLVSDTRIVTARHNFNNIQINQLYVRFFKYGVQPKPDNWLEIQEHYLDVPVVKTYTAKEGLDAGQLEIPTFEGGDLSKYAKVLPCNNKLFDNLSPGHYAMFHFAGGKPQISTGEVKETLVGASLHDAITIQAGPGASGAAIIYKAFENVAGGGISIYRMIDNGCVERRILSFSLIQNPFSGFKNEISYPYHSNPDFYVIPSHALTESGYEFLRWRDEAHGKRRGFDGRNFPKPGFDVYRVQEHHSAHHIIPIDDMIYLWEYLHELDEDTSWKIRQQVIEEAKVFGQQNHDQQLDRNLRYTQLYQDSVNQQYGRFHRILDALYPSFYDNYRQVQLNHRNGFAWSLWNLFEGWNGNFRVDDPTAIVVVRNRSRDYSEQTRPQGFSIELWNSIKGLYEQIQHLKSAWEPDTTMEEQLYQVMNGLVTAWNRLHERARRNIYPFNLNEWVSVGRKDGHAIYRIRQF